MPESEVILVITVPVKVSQLNVGTESFNLGMLSSEAKKTIAYLVKQPELVKTFGNNSEGVFQECEIHCGKLTQIERQTLTTLYEIFISPKSTTVGILSPFQAWDGTSDPEVEDDMEPRREPDTTTIGRNN